MSVLLYRLWIERLDALTGDRKPSPEEQKSIMKDERETPRPSS